MFKFKPAAQDAYEWAIANGICNETPEDIWFIVQDQEVVSYATEKGTVTFDYMDFYPLGDDDEL